MKTLRPAPIVPEPANPTRGMRFIDAAGKGCMWPLSGAGADMMVCGRPRPPGKPYCEGCAPKGRAKA